MRDNERQQFVEGLVALALVFRHEFDSRGVALEAYWRALRDLPLDSLGRAMDRAMRECRFMPVPAELRAFCRHWEATEGTFERARERSQLGEAERRRVAASWGRRLPAKESGPEAVAGLIGEWIKKQEGGKSDR